MNLLSMISDEEKNVTVLNSNATTHPMYIIFEIEYRYCNIATVVDCKLVSRSFSRPEQ